MAIIVADQLAKVYRTSVKQPGLGGAIKALFRPHFEEKTAVDQISFTIEPGEMVGYIGVNGAGKSTTIKMLTGILVPSHGRVEVLGREPHRQRVATAREIGVVFGQRSQLWWDLALIESLNLIAKIYEVPDTRYRALLARFSEQLELEPLLKQSIRNLSLGQKMRAELAATLIHEPKIVFLDEPTIGLDLLVKERIRAFIKEQNREHGTTVLLTTHDLGDIEELCQRVIIIDSGKLIYDGPINTIKERFGAYRSMRLETSGPLVNELTLPVGVEIAEQSAQHLELRFNRNQTSASQLVATVMAQIDVVDFALAEPDLAAIIRQIYQGALRT
jgi:ABC-2 type transport system ATP-binding protein